MEGTRHLTLPNRPGVHVSLVALFRVMGIVHSNDVNDVGARIKKGSTSHAGPYQAIATRSDRELVGAL
jgi:hypothetical protein